MIWKNQHTIAQLPELGGRAQSKTPPVVADCKALSLEDPVRNAVVYDLTRLFVGPFFSAPRGIDRVDFLLARHFLRSRTAIFSAFCRPHGAFAFMSRPVRRILARLEELWAESIDPADDLVYPTLLTR